MARVGLPGRRICIYMVGTIRTSARTPLDSKTNNAQWSPDKYIKAWNFASQSHEGQKLTGTNVAYINHIGLVAMEVMTCIAQDRSIANPDLAIQCALLHDTIEDTHVLYEQIAEEFGVDVADGVLAVTKNRTLGEKSLQMKDSLARIRMQPREVWIVKLADRITNLQPPPEQWSKKKIAAYRVEADLILSELGEASEYLSERLAVKIQDYG
jgi:(p)ppGpp synthase/HD superfamily hydrolase